MLSETLSPTPAQNADFAMSACHDSAEANAAVQHATRRLQRSAMSPLDSAIASWAAHEPKYELRSEAHTAAERHLMAVERGDDGKRCKEGPEWEAAEKAERATDGAFRRSLEKRRQLASGILAAPIASLPELIQKLDAFLVAHDSPAPGSAEHDDIQGEMLEATLRDLKALTSAPPRAMKAAAVESGWWKRRDVEQLISALETAEANSKADRSDEALDTVADREMTVLEAPALGLEDLLYKQFRSLHYQTVPAHNSFDDTLYDMITCAEGFGSDDRERAILFLDTLRLVQASGAPSRFKDAFYPRALNAYLGRLGCRVLPFGDGFHAPAGMTGEIMHVLTSLSEEQPKALQAAAWLDAFVAEGGSLALYPDTPSKDHGVSLGGPVPPTDSLSALLLAIEPTYDPNGERRGAVLELARQQLEERGLIWFDGNTKSELELHALSPEGDCEHAVA